MLHKQKELTKEDNTAKEQQIETTIPFSVLISVYKKEKTEYLKQALQSVVDQTLRPTEIVIVKDGLLTKELDDCIEDFQKEYPKLFKILAFKENRGLGLALRDGVKACKYEYIARMDSDDISKPDRFEKQFGYLQKHPETALLGTWITEFSKDENKPDTVTKLPCIHQEIIKFAKRRNPFRHVTVVFKKISVIQSGNYREFLWFEDYDLFVRILQKGYIAANIPEYLVNVRADKDMFTRRGGWQYLKQDYKFQKQLLKTKFIGKTVFIINITIRSIVRLIPNKLRSYFYKKFMRQKYFERVNNLWKNFQ